MTITVSLTDIATIIVVIIGRRIIIGLLIKVFFYVFVTFTVCNVVPHLLFKRIQLFFPSFLRNGHIHVKK